ncbi:hypothetical protein K438DRAFT_1789173 [Mycena galopus ATCC 62051]|nr:hypothetical protein K438DRAFT_1789173 [Mycena galopus ATCC 62051]
MCAGETPLVALELRACTDEASSGITRMGEAAGRSSRCMTSARGAGVSDGKAQVEIALKVGAAELGAGQQIDARDDKVKQDERRKWKSGRESGQSDEERRAILSQHYFSAMFSWKGGTCEAKQEKSRPKMRATNAEGVVRTGTALAEAQQAIEEEWGAREEAEDE